MPSYSRRQVLRQGSWAAVGMAMGWGGLTGCGGRPVRAAPIRGLRQMMPNSLIQTFDRQHQLRERPTQLDNRSELFQALEQPGSQSWVSLLGSDWLDQAIAKNLLQPFTAEQLPQQWANLDPHWQQATQRQGQTWGIPWRWGTTAIAYHRRRVDKPIREWADLWRPELRQRITLPDHPREVIGLTLKSLGRSYNDQIDADDAELVERLGSLHQQVLSYTSDQYQQILRMGDSWVAVGWTEDLFALQNNYPLYEVVIPTSGSALWYDCWVLPRQEASGSSTSSPPDWIPDWLEWVLALENTPRIMELSRIASVVSIPPEQISSQLRERPDLVADVFPQGELWDPLSANQAITLLTLWQQMRQGTLG